MPYGHHVVLDVVKNLSICDHTWTGVVLSADQDWLQRFRGEEIPCPFERREGDLLISWRAEETRVDDRQDGCVC